LTLPHAFLVRKLNIKFSVNSLLTSFPIRKKGNDFLTMLFYGRFRRSSKPTIATAMIMAIAATAMAYIIGVLSACKATVVGVGEVTTAAVPTEIAVAADELP
jgi:hypothetical protein